MAKNTSRQPADHSIATPNANASDASEQARQAADEAAHQRFADIIANAGNPDPADSAARRAAAAERRERRAETRQNGNPRSASEQAAADRQARDHAHFEHLIASAGNPDGVADRLDRVGNAQPESAESEARRTAAAERREKRAAEKLVEAEASNALIAEAGASSEAAREKVITTAQRVTDLEAAYVDAASAFIGGGAVLTPEQVTSMRAEIKAAKDDRDWAATELAAAEAVYTRAADAGARTGHAIAADRYLAAVEELNDPDNRVAQLQREITARIFELVPLVAARRDEHAEVAQQWALVPAELKQKIQLPPGRRPRPDSLSEFISQPLSLPVPFMEVREAIVLGVMAAVAAADNGTPMDLDTALPIAAHQISAHRLAV